MSAHRSFLILIFIWASSLGQEPTVRPPINRGAPRVANAPEAPKAPDAQGLPVAPAVPVAAPAAPAVAPGGKIVESVTEPKMDGRGLAKLYRDYTGRRVIVTAAAAAAEFYFVLEVSEDKPLTTAEAAELLRKAAVLEGFVFTQHPDDPSLDILTSVAGGPRPPNVKVDVYNENSVLPDKDIVITYVMTLSYIKPDQAVQIFNQIIGQVGTYGSISAVANASAVVITEKASLIRSLIDLKKTIDVPGSVSATRFIQVEFADVSEVATVLNELLTAQQSTQNTAGVQRAPVPGAEGVAPAAGGTAGESTPVQIKADPRTNRIFAMGRPVDLLFVENLVRQFDIPTSEKTFLRRKLRFLKVADFLPVAADALTRAFTGTGDSAASGAAGGSAPKTGSQSNARQTSSPRNSSSSSRGGSSSFGDSSGGLGGGSSGGSSGGGGVSLNDPDGNAAPQSLLVGRTQLVADNITNTVVVQGPPSALEIVGRLLDQLDVKPEQVMISTVIGQMTLNNSKELGFNYLMDGKDARGGGGGGDFQLVEPANDTVFPAFAPGSLAATGLRAYGQVGDLSAYIKALSSKTDFTVLSRPSIFTQNNQKGVISSGEKIAIPTEGGTNSGNYSSGTRIQYQDVVLKLEVIPLVNSNNEITMQIALLSDEQNGTQIIQGAGTNGGPLTVPRISTREILTTATVPNNKTIVLGGLIVGKKSKEKSGIPLLSDIPYLGTLFGANSNKKDRSELLVFIQPSVISGDDSLKATQDDMNRRYDVSEGARDFAVGDSGLFGMPDTLPIPNKEADAAAAAKKPVTKSRIGGIHRH